MLSVEQERLQLLLIEDDPRLRGLLSLELEAVGFRCTSAEGGVEGLARFAEEKPHLVLLDLGLPDVSGLEVLEKIRARGATPVIILTARDRGEDKVAGLNRGADDYVTKPFWTEELVARIRAVLRRSGAPEPGRRLRLGGALVDLDTRTVSAERRREEHLTPTEAALLAYLCARAGKAVRREQLISEVLRDEPGGEQLLQTHISRLRRKLGPAAALIDTIWGIGYRLNAEPEPVP